MSYMFYNCISLLYLPDISKWNTSNVLKMNNMFCRCISLSYLPNISKWNVNKVSNMDEMFYKCYSLSFLPDLSKWNLSKINTYHNMFEQCLSLSYLPDYINNSKNKSIFTENNNNPFNDCLINCINHIIYLFEEEFSSIFHYIFEDNISYDDNPLLF